MKARTVVLVALVAAVVVWWWTRKKKTTAPASPQGVTSVGPLEVVDWHPAPTPPAGILFAL